jgi:hypothetical protein
MIFDGSLLEGEKTFDGAGEGERFAFFADDLPRPSDTETPPFFAEPFLAFRSLSRLLSPPR